MRLAAILALLAAPAFAAPLDGGAIRALLSGATVTGSMRDTGRFAEFYAPDGAIRGQGYSGRWSIRDDRMCFDYGEGPTCWAVEADGATVRFLGSGGVVGEGRVAPGNPNGF